MKVEKLAVGVFRTNCYFLHNDTDVWIIDPGDQGSLIAQIITQQGWNLRAILLTHGHFDHILAIPHLISLYPETPIMIHEKDSMALGESGYKAMISFIKDVDSHLLEGVKDITSFPPYTNLLQDQQIIEGCGLRVLHTPGHSEGSVCLYLEEEDILFSGDTLFYHTIGRTDLPHADHNVLIDSIHKKLLPLKKEVKVYPGHGKMTSISNELRFNPFLR